MLRALTLALLLVGAPAIADTAQNARAAAAALFAAIAVPVWAVAYSGGIELPIPGMWWHAHEMIFGFAVAVIIGFLFTAGRNWTGLDTPAGPPLAALAALWLSGCATVSTGNPRDPWEPLNRSVSQFNDGVDAMLLKPVATVYRDQVPPLVRTGVSNFFGNLSDVWSFVNSALQFKLQNSTDNLARVQINSVFGVLGLFDVASAFNIDRHSEDFGQTLGRWGLPSGPYLVLPFLGPSSVRDGVGLLADRQVSPSDLPDREAARYGVTALEVVHQRALLLGTTALVDQVALARLYGEPLFGSRDLQLELRAARDVPTAAIPASALKQVLLNLLRNASEALQPGQRLVISVFPQVNVDGRNCLEIRFVDNGPGLPTDRLDDLLSARPSAKGGNHQGVGLAVVRDILAQWSATLLCRSQAGTGTSFQIFVPLEQTA